MAEKFGYESVVALGIREDEVAWPIILDGLWQKAEEAAVAQGFTVVQRFEVREIAIVLDRITGHWREAGLFDKTEKADALLVRTYLLVERAAS